MKNIMKTATTTATTTEKKDRDYVFHTTVAGGRAREPLSRILQYLAMIQKCQTE